MALWVNQNLTVLPETGLWGQLLGMRVPPGGIGKGSDALGVNQGLDFARREENGRDSGGATS